MARIGQLMKEGTLTNIVGVPTSVRTYEQALSECECVCVPCSGGLAESLLVRAGQQQ